MLSVVIDLTAVFSWFEVRLDYVYGHVLIGIITHGYSMLAVMCNAVWLRYIMCPSDWLHSNSRRSNDAFLQVRSVQQILHSGISGS